MPLAVLLLGAVVWVLVGRALGRLDRIRAEVDAIGPQQLDRRLVVTGPRDEVRRLAATMNRMLDRVESAVTRQRQLVADVSHDLQSPLATQRLSLEVALREPGAVDADELRSGVLGPAQAMERLVDDLLVLAAADEHAPAAMSSVDLDSLVLEEAERARGHSRVSIDTARVSAGPIRANPSEIRRAVRNLIDNAVAYASSGVELAVVDHRARGRARRARRRPRHPRRRSASASSTGSTEETGHGAPGCPAAAWACPSPGPRPSVPAGGSTSSRARRERTSGWCSRSCPSSEAAS